MDLGDIEDLISSPNEYAENERLQFDHVIARVKKTNLPNGKKLVNKKEYRENLIKNKKAKLTTDEQFLTNGDQLEEDDGEILETNNINGNSVSYLPGQAIIFVKTWGCTHNDSDAQYMAGQLQQYGYTITNNENDADLWLLNSCTVKSPAEQHFRNHIENGLKKGKKIVVSGCVSQAAPNSGYLKDISIVGVQQIDRVVEVVEETLQGRTVRLLGVKVKENGRNKKKLINLNLPKIRKNDLIEIIAINVGCLNQCTYCKTKHARGELASYTMKEIRNRARQSIKEGVKEIWLTSEDTGAYGKDLEPDENGVEQNLPNLLRSVLSVLPNDCRLRVGMTNPPYIKEHINEIVKIMNEDERIYKFLHIPVQSGSNIVLEDMKREYTIEEFQNIVDIMKEKVPGITIATDLILGFPTEAVEDFEDTVKLVERNKFPSLFINQFYPRPGTPAAKMQLIPAQEVKKRTKKVSEIFNNYFPYDGRVGKQYKILVTELSTDRNFYVGHNEFYEQILIPKRKEYLGKLVNVEIVSTGRFFMTGKLLNQPNNLFDLTVNLFNSSKFKSTTTLTCLVISLTILYVKFKKN